MAIDFPAGSGEGYAFCGSEKETVNSSKSGYRNRNDEEAPAQ